MGPIPKPYSSITEHPSLCHGFSHGIAGLLLRVIRRPFVPCVSETLPLDFIINLAENPLTYDCRLLGDGAVSYECMYLQMQANSTHPPPNHRSPSAITRG
jgi:hypothetical protein